MTITDLVLILFIAALFTISSSCPVAMAPLCFL